MAEKPKTDLSVRTGILEQTSGEMSEKMSEFINAGWELMTPPILVSVSRSTFGDINSAYFLVVFKKGSVSKVK